MDVRRTEERRGMNLPIAFEEKMKSLLGEEEYNAYLQCFDEPRHYGLRVNTRKIFRGGFLEDRAMAADTRSMDLQRILL